MTTANWFNGTGNVAWVPGDAAVFGGAGGTVAVGVPILGVNGLTFSTSGYVLNGNSLALTAPGLTIGSGKSVAINTTLGGSAGVTIAGGGNVTITTPVTNIGAFAVNAGTLTIGANNSDVGYLPNVASLAIASGATVALAGDNALFGFNGHTQPIVINGGTLNSGAGNHNLGAVTLSGGTISGTAGSIYGSYNFLGNFTVTDNATITANDINLNGQRGFDVAAGKTLTFTNNLRNGGGLTKTGAGTVVLSASNAYTGDTVISEGTLVATGSNSVRSNAIRLGATGTFDVTAIPNYDLAAGQTLAGKGTVRATGGSVNFYDDNILRPGDDGTTNRVGTLTIAGNFAIQNIFAAPSGSLNYDLAAVNTPGAGVNDLLQVNGNLSLDSSTGPIAVNVNPVGGGLASGTYRLINYTGSKIGSANFNVGTGGVTGTTRQTFTVSDATPGQVNLQVIGSAANLVWKGGLNGDKWDLKTTANFNNNAEIFYSLDNVRFDDTTTLHTVNVAGFLQPASITVDTATQYTITSPGYASGRIVSTVPIVKNGVGTLTLGMENFDHSGNVTVNGGTLELKAQDNPGSGVIANDGTITVNAGATLKVSNTNNLTGYNDRNVSVVLNGGTLTTDNGVTSHVTALTLNGATVSSGTPNASFGSFSFQRDVTVNGPAGPSTISAVNTYLGGGAFIVNAGSVAGAADLNITGTILGGGSLLKLGDGVLRLGANATGIGGLFIRQGTAIVDGNAAVTGTNFSSVGAFAGDLATLTVRGSSSVAQTGNFFVGDAANASGTLNLQDAATVSATTLYVGRSTTGTVNIDGSASLNVGQLFLGDLAGGDGVVNQNAGTVTVTGNSTAGLGAGTYRLNGGTLTGAGSVFATSFRLNSGTVATTLGGSGVITKATSGTVTLVGAGARQPITTGTGGADIQQGKLVLDYAGGASPAGAITPLLQAAYASNFAAGQIRSSTATSARGLGYIDSVATSKYTIAYTLYGDSNLDLLVNFDDLLTLAQNYGGNGKVWAQGDTNYDGLVNFDDLLKLAQNYGGAAISDSQLALSAGVSFANDWALAQSLVPEPASLAVVLGTASMLRRRRR